METELRKILTEIYRGQKENNDEAVERILLLLNVVGRSEQYCDWCSSLEDVEVKICKRCRQGMEQHR